MWLQMSLSSASKQKEAGRVCEQTCLHTYKGNKKHYEEAIKSSRLVLKTREAEADLDQMNHYYRIWTLSESD